MQLFCLSNHLNHIFLRLTSISSDLLCEFSFFCCTGSGDRPPPLQFVASKNAHQQYFVLYSVNLSSHFLKPLQLVILNCNCSKKFNSFHILQAQKSCWLILWMEQTVVFFLSEAKYNEKYPDASVRIFIFFVSGGSFGLSTLSLSWTEPAFQYSLLFRLVFSSEIYSHYLCQVLNLLLSQLDIS